MHISFDPIAACPYLRWSSAEQRHGLSLARQGDNLAAYIAAKGWKAEPMRIDDGRSGFHAEHRRADRELGRFELEALAGEHTGKVLVLENLDRLSREDEMTSFMLINKLLEAGVSIATIDGDALYRAGTRLDMIAIITILIKARTAHEESLKKSTRAASNWAIKRARLEAGKAITANRPPWLDIDDQRRFVIIEGRVTLVRRMFELAEGGMGVWTMARLFNSEGILPWSRYKSREPKCWNQTFLARILRSRTVIGEFQPKSGGKPVGEPLSGYFPTIIDADLWQRVQFSKPARETAGRTRCGDKVANIFNGLIHCQCGARMHYQQRRLEGSTFAGGDGRRSIVRRTTATLVCPSGQQHACSNLAYWSYLKIEDALTGALLHLAMDDTAFANRGELGRLNITIAERQHSLELARGKAERLWSVYGDNPSDNLATAASKVDQECQQLAANLEALKRQREEASGRATSQEHLLRVADIRDDLYAEDRDVRLNSRRRVAVALHGLIEKVVFTAEKASVHLRGNAGLLVFDRKGRMVGGFDLIKDGRNHVDDLQPYLERRQRAKSDGKFFSAVAPSLSRC